MDMNNSLVGFMFLFIKVPVGTIGIHSKRHFSAENISFEIRNSEFEILNFNYKSPGWNHRKLCETHFSAENISFEIGIFNYKSPGWNHRNSFEKTLFSRKYFV